MQQLVNFKYGVLLRLAAPILLHCITACSSQPYIVETLDEVHSYKNTTVFVVEHEWHTGFVIPAKDIQQRLPALKSRFGPTPHLEFGWGDKGFYQAQEITSGLTLQAIFWPTESVMHVVAVPRHPAQYFNANIETVCLDGNGYARLLKFIENSFLRGKTGGLVAQKTGLYGDSQFYTAVGDYYLMNTCNKWTAKGLRSAGLDLSTTFKLTSGSIMDYLEDYREDYHQVNSEQINNYPSSHPVCE